MLKKFIISIIPILCLSFAAAAQGKWDDAQKRYTDHTWNFHWSLLKELEWEKVQPNERHTVFAAKSPYDLYAFVNINPDPAGEKRSDIDFWDKFEAFKTVLKKSWKLTEERTGCTIYPILIEKCRFGGANAVKAVAKTDFNDDVTTETAYGVTYTFRKDNATWNVTIKVSSDTWDAIGEAGVKKVFAGFGMNAKQLK